MEKDNDEFSFNKNDKEILKFWDENKIFEKSLQKNKNSPLWTFLDGPPFVNGTPHSGHVLVSYVKDSVIRYKSMNGFYVPRTIGYDCHGLPLEQAAEKKIGISRKDEIEKFGIGNYNNVCREIISECSDVWEKCFHTMGRWVDVDSKYKTMDLPFMETEWWVFKELFKKGLVYRGFKIMPYSYACTTALSNFEANSNYKDVIDQTATVTFPILDDDRFNNCSFLAWTTTPWTLPSNIALCVNPDMVYVKIWDKKREHFFILAESLLQSVYKINKKNKKEDCYSIEKTWKGVDLVGIKYQPLFSYFSHSEYFQVVSDNFVTDTNGTGIVHLAPAFGEDDFRVCEDNGIVNKKGDRLVCPVDESGKFTNQVKDYSGRCVKDCDKDIIRDLKGMNRLFSQEPYKHSYPHCWRTDEPLIYKCIDAWFINVESLKDKLLSNNAKTNWTPNYVKEARFHNWLKDAKDWCVSRSRYWGTPIPIWMSDDGEEIVCIGSVEELKNETGIDNIQDLHKEYIDHLTIPSRQGRGMLKKIPDVFDCWYESGLCGLARYHYPFENKQYCEDHYPVDFITESLDQTRGWFYTLTVLSTALFNKPAFKNVIVTGLIQASDGKKMSKRLKNYTDPMILIDQFGSDPLRLYLISSPVVRAEPFSFQDEGVKQVIRKLLPWYNAYKFFNQCYKKFKINFPNMKILSQESDNVMDQWIQVKLDSLCKHVRKNMDEFKLYKIHNPLMEFIDQLTNWYIKLNRDRLKGLNIPSPEDNCMQSLSTLYKILYKFNIIMAPFTPFFCEYLHQELKDLENTNNQESVHLLDYPENIPEPNPNIERQMERMQSVIDIIRKMKVNHKISLSTPVQKVIVCHLQETWRNDIQMMQKYIISEGNIIEFEIQNIEKYVKFVVVPQKGTIGKKFKKKAKQVITLINQTPISDLPNLTFESEKIETEYYAIKPELNTESDYEIVLENDILVFMDTETNELVTNLYLVNQFKKEIQNLRYEVGLEPWEKIKIFYTNSESELAKIIQKNIEKLKSMISYDILPVSHYNVEKDVIISKQLNIINHEIQVILVRDI
ncbi:tRNA synthetases class I (I, L, M and V) [seawater metagenome]|uniref:isoleucine--tRNA ligase n=1 Tax=seawater metagenome TaxID=1561972 RepID=A0A5E8CH25_9ZZZZ